MKTGLIALLSGVLFGAGLALSGMMDPARVRGFLDLFGAWDPTLAFVMAGATLVMAAGWLVRPRLAHPLDGGEYHLPDPRPVDAKLIGGAAIFGAGWGVAGLCPGPAIASLGVNQAPAAIFVAAMLAGMALHRLVTARPSAHG